MPALRPHEAIEIERVVGMVHDAYWGLPVLTSSRGATKWAFLRIAAGIAVYRSEHEIHAGRV